MSTKIAYAASTSLDGFIGNVDTMIINPLIGLLFALAIVYFLYGVFEFLSNQENEEKKTTGKSHMIWGIIGITIMMGVWTILGVVLNTLGISKDQINPEQGTVHLSE
ncbi:pilin [Patescibacteria group bacterium]|nr:pilin [Patescibacteria group bacterium]